MLWGGFFGQFPHLAFSSWILLQQARIITAYFSLLFTGCRKKKSLALLRATHMLRHFSLNNRLDVVFPPVEDITRHVAY